MAGGRTLLLTSDDPARPGGGREQVSRLLHDVLQDLSGAVEVIRLTGRGAWRDGLAGRLNGLDMAMLRRIADRAAADDVARVFIDGSNLGAAASAVKRRAPQRQVITFFHNCETQFFAQALTADPGPRRLAVLVGHRRAERAALRWSDCRIALCARDSAELLARFGRGADLLAPLALADRRDPHCAPIVRDGGYALFVGGGFFGNLAGLEWYAAQIAPRLALRTVVVGRGLESLATRLPAQMEWVGAVDDLSPWYAGARLVVAPIRMGAGMKAKVAEALMHGKYLVGAPEAFCGYGADVITANACCAEAESFVAAIDAACAAPPPLFDPAQRALYERDHSPAALRAHLSSVMR